MSAASTRLLVLGVCRFQQPTTGYAVMRELVSWEVHEWASVNPGSVYGALRALVKDGMLTEIPGGSGKRDSVRHALTDEGDSLFLTLLRGCLWEVRPYDPSSFLAAMCFLPELRRDEVVTALAERALRLQSQDRQLDFDAQALIADDATAPPHAVEIIRLTAARLKGELAHTQRLEADIRAGVYTFVDDGARWIPAAKRT